MTESEAFKAWAQDYYYGLQRDIALGAWQAAIAHERERCANVCESLFDSYDDSCDEAELCAAAIRQEPAQ